MVEQHLVVFEIIKIFLFNCCGASEACCIYFFGMFCKGLFEVIIVVSTLTLSGSKFYSSADLYLTAFFPSSVFGCGTLSFRLSLKFLKFPLFSMMLLTYDVARGMFRKNTEFV